MSHLIEDSIALFDAAAKSILAERIHVPDDVKEFLKEFPGDWGIPDCLLRPTSWARKKALKRLAAASGLKHAVGSRPATGPSVPPHHVISKQFDCPVPETDPRGIMKHNRKYSKGGAKRLVLRCRKSSSDTGCVPNSATSNTVAGEYDADSGQSQGALSTELGLNVTHI